MNVKLLKMEDENRFLIFVNNENVGEVVMQVYKNFLLLHHIDIYKEYRYKGYGKIVVKMLLKSYIIMGESLRKSARFWNSCIEEFGGYKIKKTNFGNTVFTFIIGKNKINEKILNRLLQKTAEY